jgi:beta-phosphoglucomutase-like phosphatase (HAD superfamily)
MSVRALLLDYNGTLSRDEPLLCELFHDLFAEQGKPLSEDEYYAQLSGLADREIACTWLGRDDPEVVAEYARRYVARASDGSTIPPEAREAVQAAGAAGARLAARVGRPACRDRGRAPWSGAAGVLQYGRQCGGRRARKA